MVQPALWGPAAWQMLFACTWNCPDHLISDLRRLVEITGALLPCLKCRQHFARHVVRVDRRTARPVHPRDMLFWLWCLKDEVNRELRRPSIRYDDLTQRFIFHGGGVIDDVTLGDSLVIFAISATASNSNALFVELCSILANLLPLPDDSELRQHLQRIRASSVVAGAVRAARAARIERGFPELSRNHYVSMIDDT